MSRDFLDAKVVQMKFKILLFCFTSLLILLLFSGCNFYIANNEEAEITVGKITPQEAKKLIDSDDSVVLLDVRTPEEHNEIRIPESLNIAYDQIKTEASEKLPTKDSIIIVYCRSGRRSSIAVESLLNFGFTNVRDLGGIIDWPYDTISGS